MTPIEIVRDYFPEFNDEMAHYILWEETSFPCIPYHRPRRKPVECLRHQLLEKHREYMRIIGFNWIVRILTLGIVRNL